MEHNSNAQRTDQSDAERIFVKLVLKKFPFSEFVSLLVTTQRRQDGLINLIKSSAKHSKSHASPFPSHLISTNIMNRPKYLWLLKKMHTWNAAGAALARWRTYAKSAYALRAMTRRRTEMII